MDYKHSLTALDQRASAIITIVDFSLLTGKTVTVQGTPLLEGVLWNAATDNATTAASLAAAIEALAGFTAAAVGAVVTAYWETPGTAGNAKTLTTDAVVGGLTLSGATFSGGVAASYSAWFAYDQEKEARELEATLDLTALPGSSPTVDVSLEYSYDKVETQAYSTAFTQKTGAGKQTIEQEPDGNFFRFKIVLGGTNPIATGDLFAIIRG